MKKNRDYRLFVGPTDGIGLYGMQGAYETIEEAKKQFEILYSSRRYTMAHISNEKLKVFVRFDDENEKWVKRK